MLHDPATHVCRGLYKKPRRAVFGHPAHISQPWCDQVDQQGRSGHGSVPRTVDEGLLAAVPPRRLTSWPCQALPDADGMMRHGKMHVAGEEDELGGGMACDLT